MLELLIDVARFSESWALLKFGHSAEEVAAGSSIPASKYNKSRMKRLTCDLYERLVRCLSCCNCDVFQVARRLHLYSATSILIIIFNITHVNMLV